MQSVLKLLPSIKLPSVFDFSGSEPAPGGPSATLESDSNANALAASSSDAPTQLDPLSSVLIQRAQMQRQPTAGSLRPPAADDSANKRTSHNSLERATDDVPERRHLHSSTPSVSNSLHPMPSQQTLSSANPASSGKFLTRLLKSERRDDPEPAADIDRDEGFDADIVGYRPNYPAPTKYIQFRTHHVKRRDMSHVFLAQELQHRDEDRDAASQAGSAAASIVHGSSNSTHFCGMASRPADTRGAIRCCAFSCDGQYMATAGADQTIRIWKVLARREDASQFAPVFENRPVRIFAGHTNEVLTLSWSVNNFLLSASMDKTVKLWHADVPSCIHTFIHPDIVTSICFHPTDDRFFASGSLDKYVRLWSILEKEVSYQAEASAIVTAVAFAPDGQEVAAGGFDGQCSFYKTMGMHLLSSMAVRSTRGKNSKASKISSIKIFEKNGAPKMLVSSNDSRIRLYNYSDKTLEMKFKGHQNEQSQIGACISDDFEYIISGSEDSRTYIWRYAPSDSAKKKAREDYEYMHTSKGAVTVAILAPTRTRKLLALANDPVYDVCDPPPVVLLPRFEVEDTRSDRSLDRSRSRSVHRHTTPRFRLNGHHDGQIIITADEFGSIKVFRQDCAYEIRKTALERNKRMSAVGLSPTHSWIDTLSVGRARSLRASSPSPFKMALRSASPSPRPSMTRNSESRTSKNSYFSRMTTSSSATDQDALLSSSEYSVASSDRGRARVAALH